MQLRMFPFFLIALGIFAELSEHAHAQNIWLSDLPSVDSGHYKVDPYIKAAEQLQRLGRHAAIQQLYGLAHYADSTSDLENEEKTVILCRMLFTNRPGSALKRPSFLGSAFFYGEDFSLKTTSYTNWPNEPIELADGIPFAIAYGHGKSGFSTEDPHEIESYVQYCITNGVWSNYHFTQKSDPEKQEALKKLIASPKWRRPLDAREQQFLTAQIQQEQPGTSTLPLNPEPLSGKFLEEALLKVDPWSSSTNYSGANWKQLCFIAGVIQKSSPRTVSNALGEYQGRLVYQGTVRPSTVETLDDDSKLFLLMRIVFDLPEEDSSGDNWMVGFWRGERSEINANRTINRAWPIVWNNGSPRLISGLMAASGLGYSAADEFLFFKDKFRFRDLSSFKYGQSR